MHCADMSSFRAANTGSLDVQLWIHAPLCAGGVARTPRRAAMSFWRSDHAKDHADMRLTCGSHVVVCVWWHLQLLFAARGPLKTSSEPRRGRAIVFRNSRNSLNAGRRACEPAAKPAIPGVILVHNGFVWPERTRSPNLTDLRPLLDLNRTPGTDTGSPPSRCLYQYQTPAAMGGRVEHP
jgi:hypothetical protein